MRPFAYVAIFLALLGAALWSGLSFAPECGADLAALKTAEGQC